MALPSINSSAQGIVGCAIMAETAFAADSISAYRICMVRLLSGNGVSLRVASVITASVPSEPINRRVRS